MESIPPPQIIHVTATRVACDGEEDGVPGHPRVWLQMGADGWVDCGYCDRRYVLQGEAADEGH